MKYDDLLNIPYKPHGRDKNGYDCYGLALELCRRAGTPLRDVYYEADTVPQDKLNDYIDSGLNVKKIPAPKTGCLVEMEYHGDLHIGYLAAPNIIIHTTKRGVRTTTEAAVKVRAYYEVTNADNII